MSDKPATSDATVQMSPEEVARLHRALSGEATLAPQPDVAPAAVLDDARDADALVAAASRPTVRAEEPASRASGPAVLPTSRPPRPAASPAPAAAAGTHASVPVMVGAIGMFLALAGLVLLFLPKLQGMGNDTEAPGLLTVGVAHIFIAVGFFAASARTSGIAIVVGIFATLVALTFATAFLMDARIFRMPELVAAIVAGVLILPGLTWLLAGMWGFIGLRPLSGGLGISVGLTGMLGGIAGVTGGVMLLTGSMHSDDDTLILLDMVGSGGMVLAMLLAAIGFIAKVARAPRLA